MERTTERMAKKVTAIGTIHPNASADRYSSTEDSSPIENASFSPSGYPSRACPSESWIEG